MEKRKVVVASDKYKGCATSPEVCEQLERGVKSIAEGWEVVSLPQADGGEGTVEALVEALDGEFVESTVKGPRGGSVTARWGYLSRDDRGDAAVIEMAAASGLALLEPEQQDPFKTSTYGTGTLIRKAAEKGAREILLGIGGSATVDGGLGAALALGFEIKDEGGWTVEAAGEELERAAEISDGEVPDEVKELQIKVACDVTNPLLGEEGAAAVYGPQKGADEEEIPRLEENLARWAGLVENYAGRELRDEPGTGAAGGLGFGLMGLLGAQLTGGAELVADLTGLNSELENADILITGEGAMDAQTAFGKTPQVVAERGREAGVDFIVGVAGAQGEGYRELYDSFDLLVGLPRRPMTLEESMAKTFDALYDWGADIARIDNCRQENR